MAPLFVKHIFAWMQSGVFILTESMYTKFEGNASEHLGHLFVTPEMIANQFKKMQHNK